MLSLPRDLRVDIPGVRPGQDERGVLLRRAGARVETFKELTGLPINGFIEVDFPGFLHVVNFSAASTCRSTTGYYNPASTGYKSIDLKPGYQLRAGSRRSTSCASATTRPATSGACSASSSS